MTDSKVIVFAKFFSEQSHADQFIKGGLYMRKLRYFQQIEATEISDGRGDPNEGVVSWHQPDRIELTMIFPGFDPIKIGPSNLAGPLSIKRDFYSDMHVFCMSALSIPNPAMLAGDHDEVQEQLQAALQIDTRCYDFGPHVVVLSAENFIPQLRGALKLCEFWHKAKTVSYYDETTFHGDFAEQDAPFMKQSKFSYQNEYRICLQSNVIGDESMTFEVGDMSAYAIKAKSANLNEALRVTLKERGS